MELFILVIVLLLLTETTILLIKSGKKPLINTNQKRKVYVDTSALMDPRLLLVAETGFIGDELIIPRSVIHELQLLADGKDHDKRLRARDGLDMIRELERVVYFNLSIIDDALDRTPVDNRLLELAKANRGAILTNDYNLKKVAATDHIDTLNLNELALAMRAEYLPGERASIKILTAGSNQGQGVGYLRDGTMVVVDHASKHIGETVEVEFVRLNQTAAGSMMFAKLSSSTNKLSSSPKSPQSATRPNKSSATHNTSPRKTQTKKTSTNLQNR